MFERMSTDSRKDSRNVLIELDVDVLARVTGGDPNVNLQLMNEHNDGWHDGHAHNVCPLCARQ
jgi:hypothetical protein